MCLGSFCFVRNQAMVEMQGEVTCLSEVAEGVAQRWRPVQAICDEIWTCAKLANTCPTLKV